MLAAPLLEGGGAAAPVGGAAAWTRTRDGVRLRVVHWPTPHGGGATRGTVVLFLGRTEFIEKYFEPIGRFLALGFGVATLDWRGQGLSDRLLPDRRKGHVRSFREYQRDVDALLELLDGANAPRPWVLVGHSMGGAIAARTLMRQGPGSVLKPNTPSLGRSRFVAGILSAPMLGLFGVAGGPSASLAASALSAVGWAETYVPGGGAETMLGMEFDGNVLTTDRSRFDRFLHLLRAHDDLALGGATWGWVRAARREMRRLRPTATPMLVLLGDQEQVVSPEAIDRFVRRAPSAQIVELAGSRHEPFMETPAVQEVVWARITDFLNAQNL